MKNLEKCRWFPFSDEPLMVGKEYLPKYCDPQILLPEQSCDGKWHLFYHTWLGIHHCTSNSGIAWDKGKIIEVRGHSPFIYRENENYYLIYEKHDRNIPFISKRTGEGKREDYSTIEMRSSTDLVTWSKPRLLLDGRTIPFAGDYLKYPRVSRPQLIKAGDEYRLFFGASHLVLPDTKQKVSRYFACVSSRALTGPYTMIKPELPLLEPIPDDRWSNLGCGSIRVVPCNDVLYAFQCPVYWDADKKRTSSCLILLKSFDGYKWERCSNEPILVPSEKGWASSYIMGCDVHYKESEKCWYCYFSACGDRHLIFNFEAIGLLIGNVYSTTK
ncbi:MAG: hypothetical protein HUK23_06135 [Sphaerochaetaceae bacterium]|nr:hypothetical protein [Sphaerochaetaceae bacterium]